ncbi:GNAT family N-acetyltransferase [Thalassococcus sp. BH17M4-6]|uniref:GNAT family N-acetyltransferase n=1 Tax=Thalassococcus sp. BH17M4-6 TaxID=3413148 RepID=UPI003BC7967C
MTPEALSALQARAYRHMVPWSARDFADLLDQPTTQLTATPEAFCLMRVVVDEAEILAIATDPDRQRRGHGSAVLERAIGQARARGVATVFLEVEAGNAPALAFYARHGFSQTGRRRGYYRQSDGSATDALLMSRAVTRG